MAGCLVVISQNLFTTVVERTPKIEKVNVDGGRFIREAKVIISGAKNFYGIFIVCVVFITRKAFEYLRGFERLVRL